MMVHAFFSLEPCVYILYLLSCSEVSHSCDIGIIYDHFSSTFLVDDFLIYAEDLSPFGRFFRSFLDKNPPSDLFLFEILLKIKHVLLIYNF